MSIASNDYTAIMVASIQCLLIKRLRLLIILFQACSLVKKLRRNIKIEIVEITIIKNDKEAFFRIPSEKILSEYDVVINIKGSQKC